MNPRGYSTYFRFDLLGRPSHRVHALGGVAYMGYDEVGNQILNLDELENPTYFTFDGLDRQTHVKDALMAVSYMGFDNRSSPTKRVDANGRCTYMGYDAARRLERQWFTNPVAGEGADVPAYFAYNEARELARVDDRLKGLGFSYYDRDVMGRVTKKGTAAGGVYYTFDVSGMRTILRDPGQVANYYSYDAAGRLERQELGAGAGRPIYFAYDRAGQLTRRLLPGGAGGSAHRVMSYITYDAAGRELRIENRGSDYATIINYFHYERNANARPTRIRKESDKDIYYQYDALDRIVFEQHHTGADVDLWDVYEYDLASNRTKKVDNRLGIDIYYTYDSRNLTTKLWDAAVSVAHYFDWDSAQRLHARRSDSSARSHYFVHDQQNRMVRLEVLPHGATDVNEIGFTAMNERVAQRGSLAGAPQYYSFDGSAPLTQAPEGGTIAPRWRHAPGGVLPGMVAYEAGASPIQYTAGAGQSVWKQVQTGGSLESYYAYDAFLRTYSQRHDPGLFPNFTVGPDPQRQFRSSTFGEISHVQGEGV